LGAAKWLAPLITDAKEATMNIDKTTAPSAYDLLAEARWEMEGTRRAAQRYREAAATADPSTLPSGQKLLREVVPPLIGGITGLQAQGSASISQGRSVVPWAWTIQMLEAPALAMIAVVNGLNAARDQAGPMSAVTTVALEMAAAVRDEINYRAWVADQVAGNEAAREAQDFEHRDVLLAFRRRYPQADRKTWTRWRRKIEALERETWDKETSLQIGAALVHALVAAAPDRFEIATTPKDLRYLRLSEETVAMMQDIEARAAVARPRLMPMLIEPLPWRYE
jgi:hypothetical protein